LVGLYGSITDLVRTLAGLGINSSGVRQIAEAVGSGDKVRVAVTVGTLRRVAFCSGTLGSLILLACSGVVSRMTFGDDAHAAAVAILTLTVLFGDISAAQSALVQGMRRVADLARISIFGALYGTLFSIPIVYFFGERGLVPALVCVSAMAIVTSWWYARKIEIPKARITLKQVLGESSELLKLGLAFMSSSFLVMGSAYLIRLIVLRRVGVDAAGFYQAAWTLGGVYVGFIVQAMAADFYPRLTAAAKNHPECNRLVNEQMEVGLLLGAPGVLATLVLAPTVIDLFYSAKFGPAVEVLRWVCLGMLLRVASWPMGFIVLAKGARKIFFWVEVFSAIFTVSVTWVGVATVGLAGTGIGFFATYFVYCFVSYAVARRLSDFRISPANRRLAFVFIPALAVVFISAEMAPPLVGLALGAVVTLAVSLFSFRTLCGFVSMGALPSFVQKALKTLRLAPSNQ
ncbi:MAG TPA: O-antigen translocase, partial [Verrucomicrobiae bacterium]|nr:O-antigen translocase [Verrucomicrobiae bacterium]